MCPSDSVEACVYITGAHGEIYVKWALKWVIIYNMLGGLLLWAENELYILSISIDLFLVNAKLFSLFSYSMFFKMNFYWSIVAF